MVESRTPSPQPPHGRQRIVASTRLPTAMPLSRLLQLVHALFIAGLLSLTRAQSPEAAANAEQIAFDAAQRAFDSALFPRAADEFKSFLTRFPESPLRFSARERAALASGEAALASRQWKSAAESFAQFQRDFESSTNRVTASLREAFALIKAGDPATARTRLAAANTPFQTALASNSIPTESAFAGWLLLAEAQMQTADWPAALQSLENARPIATTPEQRWQRERLRHDTARAAKLITQQLAAAEDLLALATPSSDPARRAEAQSLAAQAMETAGQPDRAEPLWERNTDPTFPPDFQREAILHITELLLQRRDSSKARARLERFLNGRPADPAWHTVRLRLGQILFRQYADARDSSPLPAETAGLPAVILAQLDAVLTNQPPSELVGSAQYLRGWCLWEQGVTATGPARLREAESAFRIAADRLPPSAEQATARFKLGDAALLRNESAAALDQFLAVAEGYPGISAVDRDLRPFAWQQAVAAAIAATNSAAASRAMDRLLRIHPDAEVSGRSALLVGQSLIRQGDAASGRTLLTRFAERFPETAIAAEVRLALASGFIADRQWTNAVRELDTWVTRYTNHPALPQAEYDRAYATAEAGLATNAVEQFRTLAVRFATNPLSQTAQLWLGTHFFNLGDFGQAELAYVGVLTNSLWKGSPAVQRARLFAGQAALARGSTNAIGYLLDLLNDAAAPEAERASGYFYLGEARLAAAPSSTNAPLSTFSDALEAFTGAARFTNQPIAVAAWGRMAYCHLQLGSQSPVSYSRALELFQRILDSPRADAAARAKALVGMGTVFERMAAGKPLAESTELLERALKYHLDVALGAGFLKPGETVPPRLLEEAGVAAGQLLESRRRFTQAAGLYERLARELPALKPVWDARRERALKLVPASDPASP